MTALIKKSSHTHTHTHVRAKRQEPPLATYHLTTEQMSSHVPWRAYDTMQNASMDENECNDLAFAGFEEISFNSQ